MRRKVLVATGSRAEYGLLKPVLEALRADGAFDVFLAVTGSHLSAAHGETWKVIEADGFKIDERLDVLAGDDSACGTAHALAKATAAFADAIERRRPDWLVLLGDRWETFAAAEAALISRVPVAHLCGGDVTEGAYDESLRHAVTKMAHLHFPTNESSARRIVQLGEDPRRVVVAGSPALDAMKKTAFLDGERLEEALGGFRFRKRNLLVTFHPATLDTQAPAKQFAELLAAVDSLGPDTGVILTKPGAEPGAAELSRMCDDYAAKNPNARSYISLGQALYWSVLRRADAVLGNSSSGLYEAVAFGKPCVNVGDRQRGRLRPASVLDAAPDRVAIRLALDEAFSRDWSKTPNPYGDGRAAERVVAAMKAIDDPGSLLRKPFFDAPGASSGPVYVVAEAGVNHDGSLERAKKLVDAAAKAGADAVKFQTFRAERLVTRTAGKARYQIEATPAGETQIEMLKKLELDEAAHRELAAHCSKRGIEFLSTPFDEDSVDLLVNTGVQRLKVPSGELTNARLLLKVARAGLPVILSTGMATLDEIADALGVLAFGFAAPASAKPGLSAFREAASSAAGIAALRSRVTLLHCTTAYPAPHRDVNLLAMDTLKSAFGLPVGLSDHSLGTAVPVAAVARGARVVEKHFTLDKSAPGPDHKASLEPVELEAMVRGIREVEAALGSAVKAPAPCEAENAPVARRSLVASASVKKGEAFTEANLSAKRPGTGVSPMRYFDWIGKKADRDYSPDDPVAP